MTQIRISLDEVLKPGQTVRVVRTVEYAFTVDIADYLDGSGDPDITVEALQGDIEYNLSVSDMSDNFDDVDEVTISVTAVEIN